MQKQANAKLWNEICTIRQMFCFGEQIRKVARDGSAETDKREHRSQWEDGPARLVLQCYDGTHTTSNITHARLLFQQFPALVTNLMSYEIHRDFPNRKALINQKLSAKSEERPHRAELSGLDCMDTSFCRSRQYKLYFLECTASEIQRSYLVKD